MATLQCSASSSSSSSTPLCRNSCKRYNSIRSNSISSRSPSCLRPLSASPFSSRTNLLLLHRHTVACYAAPPSRSSEVGGSEEVFFDGGPHIGDLVTNLIFGLSLIWLPLTLASVFRALFLRYRFTNLRVTVLSGLTGSDRKDFSYKVIKDVKYVPRFIGEWGDVVITLSDGTQVEMKSVPKFKEIAQYCLDRAGSSKEEEKGESRFKPGKGIATRT